MCLNICLCACVCVRERVCLHECLCERVCERERGESESEDESVHYPFTYICKRRLFERCAVNLR